MITINLSDEQAKKLTDNYVRGMPNLLDVENEIFTQLEQQLTPRPTSAAELAVWRHENGYIEKDVEQWKRKYEVME